MSTQRWNLAITPLSPVHMGTDADYDPTGYVIEDGVLYEFDSIAALTALPEAKRKQLDRILAGASSQDMLRHVQTFIYENREALKSVSRNQVQVSPMMEAFYQERVGQVSQREAGGRRVMNRLEIERTAWNPVRQQPYVPGSGLKGAIRTALLDGQNNGASLHKSVDRNSGKTRDESNRQLQGRLFEFAQNRFELDPLRLLRVGDARLDQPESYATQVRFALNRKKDAVTDAGGNLRQSKAEQAGLYQLLECLPGMIPRVFRGSLEIQLEQHMPGAKWPGLQFGLEQLADACNRFYGQRFDSEFTLLQKRGYLDASWVSRVTSLLAEPWLKQAMQENRAFLLRVGRHSGAESVTLNGVRNIKIMKGKGEKPGFLDHARTLWLAGDERQLQTGMEPFGWLLVETGMDDAGLPEWPQIAVNHAVREWQAELSTRHQRQAQRVREQREAEQKAREAELHRQAEEQAAEQARLEHAAREAAREKAAFEALTENGKAVHLLGEMLENLRQQPGIFRETDKFNAMLKPLAEAAAGWRDEHERTALADIVEAYYDLVGWHQTGIKADKKKKQERKKRDLVERIRRGA